MEADSSAAPRPGAGAGSGAFWLYGEHTVAAAIRNPRRKNRRLLVTEDAEKSLRAALNRPWRLPPERIERQRFGTFLTEDAVHQGVALLVEPLEPVALEDAIAASDGPVLLLDQVTDPRNVGAILRSAAAFGAACVVLQDRHAPPETGALARAASGALDIVPVVREVNLSRAIAGLGDNITGMFFDWTITGNWSWQGLVFSHGGRMLNAEETQVAFNQEPGQRAIRTLRRFVDEGRMPDIRPATMFTDFFSGRLGISMQSTAQLGRYNREIGGRFPLLTGRYPLSAPNARIPAGGNVAMMFTRDAQKQRAAWEFIKFATGPVGGTMMVNHTGYMPATTIPAEREEMLGKFYRENPNHMTTFRQADSITGWYAFPGQNALRITDVINDHLQNVVGKRAEADATLQRMAADVQALLPRRG